MQPSPADEMLASAAVGRGVNVSPRQIMRWRQAAIVSPEVRGLGRGRGVEVTYPASALDVVVMLAQALSDEAVAGMGKPVLLHRAMLVAWSRGAPVRDAALRAAFSGVYSYFQNVAASVAPSTLAAHKPRFLGEPGPDDPLVVSTILALVNGMQPPDGGIVATASGAGYLPAMEAADLVVDGVATPDLHEAMDNAAIAILAESARTASRDELDGARDWLVGIRPPGLDDLGLVMAIPLILPIVRMAIANI